MRPLQKFRALPSRTVVVALGGVSLAALIFALISQFGFGYAPCELCITQRWWHALVVLIAGLAFMRRRLHFLLVIQALAILGCFVSALFHIGVEQHWWQGTQACVGPHGAKTIADLTAQILNTPVTRCDEPVWFFLGLSMACWNAILTCLMLLVALTRLVKKDAQPLPAR